MLALQDTIPQNIVKEIEQDNNNLKSDSLQPTAADGRPIKNLGTFEATIEVPR
jgi:hypothetical protein